jgi:hypothetical protein
MDPDPPKCHGSPTLSGRVETYLEYLLEERVERVLLHLGLPLPGLAPVRQQVHFHIPDTQMALLTTVNNLMLISCLRSTEQ